MLRVVHDLDDCFALKEWFGSQTTVALDTETTGFDIYSPSFRVRTVQFGNTTEAWVVPFEQWQGVVEEMLRRFTGRWLIHNSRYDIEALGAHGVAVPWHAVDDTMIAMRLAEPHKPAALKAASVRHVSRSADASQAELHKAMKKNGWDWATVPIDFPAYQFYAAMDVILGSRLAQTPVCKEGLASPVYSLEMDVRQVCTEMERNGMRVDVGYCKGRHEELTYEIDDIRTVVKDAYDGLNLTSTGELARWLLSQGAKLTVLTDGGFPSVSKEALEAALPTAPPTAAKVMEMALRVRKLTKIKGAYFENFIEFSTDGILHPSIETVAARTGRMSIRNPALQTLPRVTDDPDSRMVRKAVIPRNEGEVLISADYDQIELRRIGSLSEDPGLIDAFRAADESGGDFFTEAMRVVYADPTIPKSDPRRNGIKTLFYASAYGAGIAKMAAQAKMPVEEMREIADRVFRRYPGVKALQKVCEREAIDGDGWITTPSGRRVWIDLEASYKAMNAKVQGDAGDIFKQALVDLAHAGLSEYFVAPVHDEILFSMPEELVDDARPVIAEVMSRPHLSIPLRAEPGPTAMTWADAK